MYTRALPSTPFGLSEKNGEKGRYSEHCRGVGQHVVRETVPLGSVRGSHRC